jgi:RNase P protein component
MREAFRLNRCHIVEDADLIMSARRGMAGKNSGDVSADFEKLCRRAGIWRG